MDVFESIDWYPSLNDMIDDEFVDVDRLERESVMYNILHGTYTDPLKDLHKENYHLVTQEHIDYVRNQEKEKSVKVRKIPTATAKDPVVKTENSAGTEHPGLQSQTPKGSPYIPGVFKKPFRFPRSSSLSVDQHALCLRVILKFSRSEKPAPPTTQEINELQTYLNLKTAIAQEQDEYLELAKKNWDGSNIKIVREDLINLKWNEKLTQLRKLHKHYNEAGTIAFSSEQSIYVNFISTVLETGRIPKLQLPSPNCRYKMHVANPKIETQYFRTTELKKENYVYQDVNCDELAKSHEVDLVISSSGLNCLATNLNTNHSNTWILPIVIKNCNSKNIIFIDKPLPSTAKNVMEKNTWVYKYILKYSFLRDDNERKTDLDDPDSVQDVNSNTANTSEAPTEKTERNAQYNIYTIGACGSSQNELMKNKIRQDYKILVRTKIDAIEELEDGLKACVKIVPKLEHQTALGAEAVTLDEAAKQWISLTFTPDAYVIRVRIDQSTTEFLQTEKRTTSSINNELNRLYNVKGENILTLMYNIIEIMRQMSPGRYLLRHTPRNGAFSTIYKATDSPGRNSINLENIYCEDIFRTIPKTPWPILDKMIPTPASKFFNRMPAMYYPRIPSAQLKQYRAKQNLKNAVKGTQSETKPGTKTTKKKKKKSGQSKKPNNTVPEQS